LALGNGALASNTNAIAQGTGAQATGVNGVAIGNGALASNTNAIAQGTGAKATGVNSIAIGTGALATGSIAMGNTASASNGGTAIGDFANATCPGCTAQVSSATAIGNSASATVSNSVAVGQSASVQAVNGSAFGANAVVQPAATNAVAIGQGSVATAPNTVSFGTPGNERRLTNIAPGILPTDAATVSQLTSMTTGVQTQIAGLQNNINTVDRHAKQGTATAIAMGGFGGIPDGKNYAVFSNFGTYGSENSFAGGLALRITDATTVNGAVGFGVNGGPVGGRVGVQFAW
jgi:autotransporter adhesin